MMEGHVGRHFRIAIAADEICSNAEINFQDILGVAAVKGLANGLKNEFDSNKSATSAALFISELFKLGWLSNDFYLQCMDRLSRDNFNTLRYAEVMTALLAPSTSKIKAEIKDDRFMFYLQLIRARTASVGNSQDLRICTKLSQVLEKIVSASYNDSTIQPIGRNALKQQPVAVDCKKLEEIVELVKMIDLNDLELAVNKIDWIMNKNEIEVNSLVATLIQQAMLVCTRAEIYAQLAFMLCETADASIKPTLINQCQQKFLDCFDISIDKSKAASSYGLTQFIASLHKHDIIDQDFIKLCLDVFMSNEKDCHHTVQCFRIFMETIGPKLEASNPETINKIFQVFDQTVASENTFRSNIYKRLIQLRNNKWIGGQPSTQFETKLAFAQPPPQPFMQRGIQPFAHEQGFIQSQWLGSPLSYGGINAPLASIRQSELPIKQVQRTESPAARAESSVDQRPKSPAMISIVINFEKMRYEDEIDAVAFDLKENLTSIARIVDFINALIRINFKDYKQISTCAELLQRLTSTTIKTKLGNEIKFSKCLLDALNLEFVNTCGLQALTEDESINFANVSILTAELYMRDIFTDDDLSTWLLNKHTKSIPVQHLSHLSSVISPKIQVSDSKHLKMILGLVEDLIQMGTNEVCKQIKDDILEIFDVVTYLKQFKENNPQSNGV